MRRYSVTGLMVIFCAGMLAAGVEWSHAGNSVSGSLTLNKANIKLIHAYVDEDNPNSPIVALSDKSLPVPFSIGLLDDKFVKKNKVHVLIFEISPEEKKLAAGGLGALYFPGKKTHYIAIADKLALTLEKIDATLINGSIKTPKPVVDDFYEITLSCEASFKVSRWKLKAEAATAPKNISVTGDNGPPAKAYAGYYRVCLSGDKEKMRRFLSSKALKEYESFDDDSREMIAELCRKRPHKVKLTQKTVSDDGTWLSVVGTSRQGEKATGTVKMRYEEGQWKVEQDKWEFISQ